MLFRSTNDYIKPTVEELRYFDRHVLEPLLRIISEHKRSQSPSSDLPLDKVREIAQELRRYNYLLSVYRQIRTHKTYVILASSQEPGVEEHFWGTYVFKVGNAAPYIIEAPYPLIDLSTPEFAAYLFVRMDAQALLVAGGHPMSNQDRSADVRSEERRVGKECRL